LRVSRGPPDVHRISIRVNQEVSQDQLEVRQGICSGSVLSGVCQELVRSRSGVGQESVRCRSGVGQEFIRSPSGVGQESIRSQSGVRQESIRGPN